MSAKRKKEGVIEEEREKRVNPVAYALKGIWEQDCLTMPLCILLQKGKVDEPSFQGIKKYTVAKTCLYRPDIHTHNHSKK